MMGEILPKRKFSFDYFFHQIMTSFTKFTTEVLLKIDVVFEGENKKILSYLLEKWHLRFFSTGIYDKQLIDADPESGKNES